MTQGAAQPAPNLPPDQPQRVIANAAQLLSNISSFRGCDHRTAQGESFFITSSSCACRERRVLVILVSPDGDVQNRVIVTDPRLRLRRSSIEASNFLIAHYRGLTIEDVRERLKNRG